MVEQLETKPSEVKVIEYLQIPQTGKIIPVYDFRSLDHQESIAKALVNGNRMALFGGVWGGFKGVKQATKNEGFFYEVKPGRPREARIATLMSPEMALGLIDWSKVHPKYRFLENYRNFKTLWSSHDAYLHIIAPIRSTLSRFPEIFVTTPEDFKNRYPNWPSVKFSTASFVWRDDPYMRHFSALFNRFSRIQTYVGVSTTNPHGEEPPYLLEEMVDQLLTGKTPSELIDLIVKDDLYASFEAFSSHSQIRLPLLGESPTFKVIRIGGLSPEKFRQATGFEIEMLPNISDVRKNPGENLDKKLELMKKEILLKWSKEKPKVFFRD